MRSRGSRRRRTWRAFRRSRFPAGLPQTDCRWRCSSLLRRIGRTSCLRSARGISAPPIGTPEGHLAIERFSDLAIASPDRQITRSLIACRRHFAEYPNKISLTVPAERHPQVHLPQVRHLVRLALELRAAFLERRG